MKVRRDGPYSGRPLDGKKEWPTTLRGTREIAAYLRWHPETVGKFLRERRLPGCRDAKGVWFTTRSLIDKWILQQQATQDSAVTLSIKGSETGSAKIGPLDRKSGFDKSTEMKVDWNKVPRHILEKAIQTVADRKLKEHVRAEIGLVQYADEVKRAN